MDYEDIVFWLSINSNESTEAIRRMSHGERIGFQNRLTKWLMEKQKASRGRSEDENE